MKYKKLLYTLRAPVELPTTSWLQPSKLRTPSLAGKYGGFTDDPMNFGKAQVNATKDMG